MAEKHSHPDFQNGRKHDVDRRHQGGLSPHLHKGQALRAAEIRNGVRPRSADIVEIDVDRNRAMAQYKMAIADIPIDELYGHQLEERGVCGKCRGGLKHPMDKHYHSISREGASLVICCGCLLDLRGITCPETWTKMKHLRAKIADITQGLEERWYYWICVECGHKWRNKNPEARACSECDSNKVRGVKVKAS